MRENVQVEQQQEEKTLYEHKKHIRLSKQRAGDTDRRKKSGHISCTAIYTHVSTDQDSKLGYLDP